MSLSPRFERLESRNLLSTVPAGFTETVLASNLSSPVTLDIEENGRIWVAYQDGRIDVVENDQLLPMSAFQLNTDAGGERGLQGLELDPEFHHNSYLYVYYTASSPASHNRVSRLTVDPTTQNTILAGSEVVLLDLPNLSTVGNPIWHMGGALNFMTDGTLAIQVGDHQGGSFAQDNESPFGKLLRIDPATGAPKSDNPFYDVGNGISWQDYIWASGMRNPFSGDVDFSTGQYVVGDVGQGSWEEINDATVGGLNFGWSTTEGNSTNPAFTNPLHTYSHSNGCAITGTAFYNPETQQFPGEYQGKLFFSDLCAGEIRVIDSANPGAVEVFLSDAVRPMNIEFSADGSMYYISHAGQLLKVQYAVDTAPQIILQPEQTLVSEGYSATFSTSASGTPVLTYQWQKWDGVQYADLLGATENTLFLPSVSIADDGALFRAVVSNVFGTATSTAAMLDVTLDTPPMPTIGLPEEGLKYRAGDTISFSGTATDQEDGVLALAAMTWQVDFHHNVHLHPFVASISGISNGTFTIPVISETASDVWYRIHLSVTDSAGLTTEVIRDIYPELSDFEVTTSLDSGEVLIDGQAKETPFAVTGVVGVQRTFEAPSQIVKGDLSGTFLQWLDGETSRERITLTPEDDTAYVALYSALPDNLVYLSDLTPTQATSGWGPVEFDTSNNEKAAGDGNPITIDGVVYNKGLGVHSLSDVRYSLDGGYQRLISDIGLDDEEISGTVVFQVFGDGTLLYDSGLMTSASDTQTVNVDITGVDELRLYVTDGGDNKNNDHADWADARIFPLGTLEAKINFQLDSVPIPVGYFEDTGEVFGDRGNGLEYGWSTDHTDLSRDRNKNSNQRLDTLVHFHASQDWELTLPNGTYAVTVSIGDAGHSSTHTLNVEGVSYWDNALLEDNEFARQTQYVTVTDGHLTLDIGGAAEKATRINYVEVWLADESAGLLPLTSADITLDAQLSYADVGAFAAGWGTHDGTLTLEEQVRLGDLNFDGATDQSDWDIFIADWDAEGMPTISLNALLNPRDGDFNYDEQTNGFDFLVWQRNFGQVVFPGGSGADGDGSGVVDAGDLTLWKNGYREVNSPLALDAAFEVATSLTTEPEVETPVLEDAAVFMLLEAFLTPRHRNLSSVHEEVFSRMSKEDLLRFQAVAPPQLSTPSSSLSAKSNTAIVKLQPKDQDRNDQYDARINPLHQNNFKEQIVLSSQRGNR